MLGENTYLEVQLRQAVILFCDFIVVSGAKHVAITHVNLNLAGVWVENHFPRLPEKTLENIFAKVSDAYAIVEQQCKHSLSLD